MTDFYSELRPELLHASDGEGTRGSFDPMVKVTTLDPALARQLDTRGGELPSASVEAGGSETVRSYATSLHETVHWWQMMGSTTGLLSGLTTAAQTTACAPYLPEIVGAIPKAVLWHLEAKPERVDRTQAAWKAASRWRDLEIASCLLVDPLHGFYKLRDKPFLFESVGYALAQHAATTTGLIERVVGEHELPLPEPEEWERFILDARASGAPGFEAETLAKIRIGAKHLFEGQARLIELQYRDLAVERRSLPDLSEQGWLDGDYGVALDCFLERVDRPLPEDPQDPLLCLFLLLCDMAINPSRGYPSPTGAADNWVASTHPGLRFESLCSVAAKRLEELQGVLKILSLQSYRKASELLIGESDWLAADQVAGAIAEGLSGHDLWDSLPEADDVAAHLIVAAHQSFCAMKAEIPHFFCWPAAFLTTDSESNESLDPYKSLLELYSPPFHTGPDGREIDTVHLPELDSTAASKVANRYFRTAAIYELVRQWLTQAGPFKFDYPWKSSMSPVEIENLARTFEQSVGVRLEDVGWTADE